MDTTRLIAAATVVFLAACGGSDPASTDATAEAAETNVETSPPVATEAAPAAGDPVEAPEAETTVPATTEAPAPTTTTPPAAEPFDLTALPDLIAAADAAATDPNVAPFDVVDDVVGFPLQIPVPDGSTLHGFDATLSFIGDDGAAGWNARYDVVAPGGMVDDIDINLDDNGPGSLQLIDYFDPILAELGLERKNSTASDPGDPGGPNSVNHVYVAPDPAGSERMANGVAVTLDPVFIWSSEDINGWAYDDARPELGGYTVDVDFDTATFPADGSAPTPFPLVDAVIVAFPLPDGLTLDDVSMSFRQRSANAFDIDEGASYLDVVIRWHADPAALDDIVAFYADPAATFTDPDTVMAGEDSFFDEGTIELSEPWIYDGTDTHLDLLWLRRHAAMLRIAASDDGVEPVEVTVDIEINPNDIELALPES